MPYAPPCGACLRLSPRPLRICAATRFPREVGKSGLMITIFLVYTKICDRFFLPYVWRLAISAPFSARPSSVCNLFPGLLAFIVLGPCVFLRADVNKIDVLTGRIPKLRDAILPIQSPTLLHLVKIKTKAPGRSVDSWNFLDASYAFQSLPAASFNVTAMVSPSSPPWKASKVGRSTLRWPYATCVLTTGSTWFCKRPLRVASR